jgi:hypothetical protein
MRILQVVDLLPIFLVVRGVESSAVCCGIIELYVTKLGLCVSVNSTVMCHEISQRSLSRYSGKLLSGRRGFDSWQENESFLYSTAYRPNMGPTKPLTQCERRLFRYRLSDRGLNLTTHLHPSAVVKKNGAIIPPPTPIRLHDVVLN